MNNMLYLQVDNKVIKTKEPCLVKKIAHTQLHVKYHGLLFFMLLYLNKCNFFLQYNIAQFYLFYHYIISISLPE